MPGYSATAPKPPGGYVQKANSTVSPRCMATGGLPPSVSTDFNDTAIVATTMFIAELPVGQPVSSRGFAVFNGSVVTNGNTKVGLFDAGGTIVATAAAVASVGTDTFQRLPWTSEFVSVPGVATALTMPLQLSPGTYFVGVIGSSTSDKINTHLIGNFGATTATVVNATALATTSLSIVPPTTFTTAVGPVGSLY